MAKKRIFKSQTERAPATARKPRPRRAAPRQPSPAVEDETEAAPPDRAGFSIVGIGASAGGYEAFLRLIGPLPADTGMAFVLVQHLDPHHESKLTELLGRSTTLPVKEARNGMRIHPDHIYVMPPNVSMSLAGDLFRFQARKGGQLHLPIDYFFRSLAEERPDRAIGIVLSGTGTDGTFGLQAIKGGGGITFAQDGKTAKYFGMPGSAIAAGCVDLVMDPESIARELGRIARHPYVGHPRSAPAKTAAVEPDQLFRERNDEMQVLFALLRSRSNVDFSHYKHSTLKRRIMRRMLLHKIDALPAYLKYLRAHLGEVDNLFNDLLINVTGFFRDPKVFQALKRRIFPKLLKDRPGDGPVRIWVCGCSTGEEAYSLAISLTEFLQAARIHLPAQIFATDISEPGLEKARAGIFPENILRDVSPERLRRFFIKTNNSNQVSKAIRDMCVFARQNVITDPPFSNLDLISCRNVLIYLGQVLQKKIMPVFHYALKPGGYLLLGSSETIGVASDLFSLLDKRSKIYTKTTTARRSDIPMTYKEAPKRPEEPHRPDGAASPEARAPDLQQYVDRLILSKWSPGAVVINAQMEVLLFRGRTGNYLEHAAGNASLNLLKMARESLVLDLRTAIAKAMKQDAAVRLENAAVRHNGHVLPVAIEVIPFRSGPAEERYFLVLFQENRAAEVESPRAVAGRPSGKARKETERREMTKLREELATSRESLQAIIEEQEATNEELKSANEEIQSSNEELQSTNEELESAKEELQSTNEELTTLNEELQTRNSELSQVNNDFTNLFVSVNVAIIMLGPDLTIRRFTPAAERIFNLIPSDTGRRFSDLNRQINVPDLEQSVQQVVDTLNTLEREVQDREGRWYSLRIRPYRTQENKIDGAVMMLVDIDEHKQALEVVMDVVKEPLISLTADLCVKKANRAFYELFRVAPEETEGRFIFDVGGGHWNIPKLRTMLEEILPRQTELNNYEVTAEFPGLGRRTMKLDARAYYEDGRSKKLVLLAIKDITE